MAVDDGNPRGNVVHGEHVVGGQHLRAVELEPGNGKRRGAEPVAIRTLRPRIWVPSETCTVRPSGASVPVPGIVVTLRPLSNDSSPDVRRSITAACASATREVHARCRGLHAELGRAAHGAQHLGRLQQLLGRDAAAVQARTADAAAPRPSRCSCRPTRRRARPRSRRARRRARRDRNRRARRSAPMLGCGGVSGRPMTWTANATRITRPVSAARMM